VSYVINTVAALCSIVAVVSKDKSAIYAVVSGYVMLDSVCIYVAIVIFFIAAVDIAFNSVILAAGAGINVDISAASAKLCEIILCVSAVFICVVHKVILIRLTAKSTDTNNSDTVLTVNLAVKLIGVLILVAVAVFYSLNLIYKSIAAINLIRGNVLGMASFN